MSVLLYKHLKKCGRSFLNLVRCGKNTKRVRIGLTVLCGKNVARMWQDLFVKVFVKEFIICLTQFV